MTFSNQFKADGAGVLSREVPGMRAYRPSLWKAIFFGPGGLRAGWRAAIFVVLVVFLVGAFLLIRTGGVEGFREAQKHGGEVTVTPLLMFGMEGIVFLLLCVATGIMGKIEHRRFGEYGLPLTRALGKDFWIGALTGFLAISSTLFAMFLLHGFRIVGFALHGTAIVSSVVTWGIAFLVAGLCEEFLCRGYIQYTLASGIGFWPAALVMSGMFAFGHSFNPNETGIGVVGTGLIALLLCLFLRRTGNLWCAVGFHAAYDWGQTLYGVPDSGILPYHNVFRSVLSGPHWLTGGIAGPEGSVFTPIVMVIVALIFTRYYRTGRSHVLGQNAVTAG